MGIRIVVGNIQELENVDCIVNAANFELRAGAGVCGAIFKAAGEGLVEECVELYQQRPAHPGTVRVTSPYNLGNQGIKYIFHAVGPDYRIREQGRHGFVLLQMVHSEIFWYAHQLNLTSIAIPAISAGIYGAPLFQTASAGIEAAVTQIQYRKNYSMPDIDIIFSVWPDNEKVYREVLEHNLAKQEAAEKLKPRNFIIMNEEDFSSTIPSKI